MELLWPPVLEPPEALVGLGPFPVFVCRRVMPVGEAALLPGVFTQSLSTRHRSEARRPWTSSWWQEAASPALPGALPVSPLRRLLAPGLLRMMTDLRRAHSLQT